MVKQNGNRAANWSATIYEEAVGREPTPEELKLAEGLLGRQARPGRRGGFSLGDGDAAGISIDLLR